MMMMMMMASVRSAGFEQRSNVGRPVKVSEDGLQASVFLNPKEQAAIRLNTSCLWRTGQVVWEFKVPRGGKFSGLRIGLAERPLTFATTYSKLALNDCWMYDLGTAQGRASHHGQQ